MSKIVRQTGVKQPARRSNIRRGLLRSALVACLFSFAPCGVNAEDIEVTNLNDSGSESLREAIENAVAGDQIVFNVPGGGTITMLSDLPEITDSLSFTNANVAPIIIDRGGNNALSVTGGVINLGELQITGAGADIVLGSAATLIGNVEQITADVTASGIIAPGDSESAGDIGELLIDGDLDTSNSTIQVDVTGGSSSDLISVIGNADITGATLDPNFIGSAYSIGDTFTVIEATAGVSGALANAADTFDLPSNPFLEASINTLASEVQLEVQDNGLTFNSLYEGCNDLASSAEIDRLRVSGTAAQIAVIEGLREGSVTSVNEAVGQLSGTIYASLVDGEINQIHNSLLSVRDRVLLQRDSLNENGRWSPWIRGYGMQFDTDTDDRLSKGYSQTVAGLELGTGYVGSSGLGVHGFAQLGSTDTDMDGLNQSADTDSYRFGGSVQCVGQVAYLLGVGGFGFQDHSVQRSLTAFTDGANAESDLDGTDQFGSFELGTAQSLYDNLLWLSFVSLQGVRSELDGTTESGSSDFNLTTRGIDGESLRSLVGFSLAQTGGTAWGPATTQLRLGWMHEFLDQQQTVQTAIQAATPVFFDARSTVTDSDWVSVGAQLDWGILFGGQLTLAYQGNLNSHSAFQSGSVGTRWNW